MFREGKSIGSLPEQNLEQDVEQTLTREQIYERLAKIRGVSNRKELIAEYIMGSDDPSASLEEVEGVLGNKNAPEAEKNFLIFKMAYPRERIVKKERYNIDSPFVQSQAVDRQTKQFDAGKFYAIVHRDLLEISVKSNDRSLRKFLTSPGDHSEILSLLDVSGEDKVLARMDEAVTAAHDRGIATAKDISDGRYKFTKGSLVRGVKCGFVPSIMEKGDMPNEFRGWGTTSHSDWYTPFDTDYFMLAKTENETRFRNDLEEQLIEEMKEEERRTLGGWGPSAGEITERTPWYYGDVVFYIKNRGQWHDTVTSDTLNESYKKVVPQKRFEKEKQALDSYLFPKPELYTASEGVGIGKGNRHVGIRTGLPSTEVDLIIIQYRSERPDDDAAEKRQKEYDLRVYEAELFNKLAQNEWYVPVVDRDMNLLFTPDMYKEARMRFLKKKAPLFRGPEEFWKK